MSVRSTDHMNPPRPRRKWHFFGTLFITSLLLITSILVQVSRAKPSRINQANREKIQLGMGYEQVITLLGAPTVARAGIVLERGVEGPVFGATTRWSAEAYWIEVVFDHTGQVIRITGGPGGWPIETRLMTR
jgi:hypothetical protein